MNTSSKKVIPIRLPEDDLEGAADRVLREGKTISRMKFRGTDPADFRGQVGELLRQRLEQESDPKKREQINKVLGL